MTTAETNAQSRPGPQRGAPRPEGAPAAAPERRQHAREQLWKRLEELVDLAEGRAPERPLSGPIARRGIARLDGETIGELGRLYRAAATHLAQARTFGASARRLEHLNRLVARAHAVVYGRPVRRLSLRLLLGSFVSFPVVVRRLLAFHGAAVLLLGLGGVYGFFGAAHDPEWALEFVAPGDDRTPFASRPELLDTLMAGREEGASGAKTAFATYLWLHNTQVALLSLFGGLLLGVPTVFLLLFNGALLGVYTATFHRHDLAYEWWAWILPHGVTELLAVALLSGTGLFVGFTLLVPGTRSRRTALWDVRGAVVQVVIFVFPMLLLAAVIESFVRQSSLSDPARYVFAFASAAFWLIYLAAVGQGRERRARRDDNESLAEARVSLPEVEELLLLR